MKIIAGIKNRVVTLTLIGVLIIIFGAVMIFYGFPEIFKMYIHDRIILQNGTEGYKIWNEKRVNPFKFHIFNVTNPEEVTRGGSPKVNEIGPYVYKVYEEKIDIKVVDDDTITYNLKKTYFFDEKASLPLKATDKITVLNVALIGILKSYSEKNDITMIPGLNELVNMIFNNSKDAFLTISVAELLFEGIYINCNSNRTGMAGFLCSTVKSMLPLEMKNGFYISMFQHLNGTTDGPYTIKRGIVEPDTYGNIVNFKNKSLPGSCKGYKGTDVSISAPVGGAEYHEEVLIYQPEICSPIYAKFTTEETVLSYDAYRYEANELWCKCDRTGATTLCANGIQSLESCQSVPFVVSFPHFYLGNPNFVKYIADGISPNATNHGSFIDIDPVSGVVLDGSKRFQINMELFKVKSIKCLSSVQNGLFPVLWIEEHIDVPQRAENLLKDIHNKKDIIDAVEWVIICVGIALILAAIWNCVC